MFLFRDDDDGEIELPGVLVVERERGIDVVARGSRVRHVRLGNTVLVALDDAGFEQALAAAEAALRATRGEPFTDQGLWDDGTGWVD
jgi:hypothetical protein